LDENVDVYQAHAHLGLRSNFTQEVTLSFCWSAQTSIRQRTERIETPTATIIRNEWLTNSQKIAHLGLLRGQTKKCRE